MEKMFDVALSGEGMVSRTVTNDMDDAVAVMDAFLNTDASGHLMDGMTGEVLMTMEQGGISYISTDTTTALIREVHDDCPDAAQHLCLMGIAAFQLDDTELGKQTYNALLNLHRELFGYHPNQLEVALAAMVALLEE